MIVANWHGGQGFPFFSDIKRLADWTGSAVKDCGQAGAGCGVSTILNGSASE